MEHFISQLEAMRYACQQLPQDFGRNNSVGEREAVQKIIRQVEDGLERARNLLRDM